MKKIKEFLIYILNIEIMGFLFILMNYYLSDSTSYLPSSFTANKSLYTI
ncbi:hypothetical protein HZY83_02780 [Gemella sp. GH3]|nr:hypothetical protein [Gemella sp. GH3.1]NYS50557.1 hypothetical protein [Gemella sp. GH3]